MSLEDKLINILGVGKKINNDAVDFNDPNRPKTCLEIDYPIIPINRVAALEGNSGKPIYQMSKWWARRRSSVFRSMIIAASTKAPEDPGEASKKVWEIFYGDHSTSDATKDLKIADIFMGGGTTLVEGSRLGAKVIGNDLNPVAWFITKNELENITMTDFEEASKSVEKRLKQISHLLYSAPSCPRGHKAYWLTKDGKKIAYDAAFELSLSEIEELEYFGPEIIYTFWSKHGPCSKSGCGHFTPLMSSPLFAIKTMSVKANVGVVCEKCKFKFDVEDQDVRIAPRADFVVAENEKPFTVVKKDTGYFSCPSCSHKQLDVGKAKSVTKKVSLSLFLHPDWMRGISSKGLDQETGGSPGDSFLSQEKWFKARDKKLKFLEFRGDVPKTIQWPNEKTILYTDAKGGTTASAKFTCQNDTCGTNQKILESVKIFGKSAPIAPYAVQCFCSECSKEKASYNGRYFDLPNLKSYLWASKNWDHLKDNDLKDCWPKSELPYGFMTHMNNGGIPNHGYTHWWKMFNNRQLLVLSSFLKVINELNQSDTVKDFILGAFQQYVRNQTQFCIWNIAGDKLEPAFSQSNFHPKNTFVENNVFSKLGRGNWESCISQLKKALEWKSNPWDLVSSHNLDYVASGLSKDFSGKSEKVYPGDIVRSNFEVYCGSSTELTSIENSSVDLVITDPPFGGLLHYAELADFFYVWLRLGLKGRYPQYFTGEYTPKTLEAVVNKARHPENSDADKFYEKLLTECWKEAYRILKPGGILAFTFHHSEDDPWVTVLESLFNAGFYLEATYPVRSDETKGEGSKPGTFGSQKIEYDIIHVCRKKNSEPTPISWAKVRKNLLRDIEDMRGMIENHIKAGLPEADLKVIKCGKALEYYSRHYDQVYIENGRHFTVKEALAGVTQFVLDDQKVTDDLPPSEAEPLTRQFLRIFKRVESLPRDQVQKMTRWSGVAASDFVDKGWIEQKKKDYLLVSPLDIAKSMKGKPRSAMSRDYDQSIFLIGACFEGSGINVKDTLNNENFKAHPAIGPILKWLSVNGGNSEIRNASLRAHKIYEDWVSKNKQAVTSQLRLFEEI